MLGRGSAIPFPAGPMFTRRCGSPAAATAAAGGGDPPGQTAAAADHDQSGGGLVPTGTRSGWPPLVAEIMTKVLSPNGWRWGGDGAPRAHVVRNGRSRATWCSWWRDRPRRCGGPPVRRGRIPRIPLYLRRGPKGRSLGTKIQRLSAGRRWPG